MAARSSYCGREVKDKDKVWKGERVSEREREREKEREGERQREREREINEERGWEGE